MRSRLGVLLVLPLCLAGCGGDDNAPASGRTTRAAPLRATDTGPDGRRGCAPASPIGTAPPLRGTGPGDPEVRGTGHGAQLWGLIMAPHTPLIRAGDDVKIVWRMTGTGDLKLSATAPDGRHRKLAWGPEEHGGSSYHRPGQEWGAGYHFDQPGCWNLHATRGPASGDVWLKVASPTR